jgi:hypothetical protein
MLLVTSPPDAPPLAALQPGRPELLAVVLLGSDGFWVDAPSGGVGVGCPKVGAGGLPVI